MNFLVTGGAGFIGSHVCERLLRDGHSVWAFDDLNDFYDPQFKRRNLREIQTLAKPFEFCHGDLTDPAALDELFSSVKFDQVIHLAARAVATNVYLRRIHHFAVALHWLPWPVLPKLHWPPIKFEHKRAIILDEHRKLIAHEPDPVRRAYYELLWHFGGSQTDMALGCARQHSHHGLRDRRPHARGQLARSVDVRVQRHLYHGSGLSGFRPALRHRTGASVLRHSRQRPAQLWPVAFASGGQSDGTAQRSNHFADRLLPGPILSRQTAAGAVLRRGAGAGAGIFDQPFQPARADGVAPLLPALARRVVLQMDQTTSADQGVLWHVAQRGAHAIVDRGERLRAGGDHPKATQN